MKKLFMTMLTFLTCGAAYALPLGNPSDASLLCDGLFWEGICGDPCDPCLSWCDGFSFRVGFYGDYVFNRHMEIKGGPNGDDIEHTEVYTNAGFFAANFWERFDVFATFGATNFNLDTNATSFVDPGIDAGTAVNCQRFTLETETYWSWSAGVRGTIWECGCTSFGGEAQYFYSRPDIRSIHVANDDNGSVLCVYPDDNVDFKYREWQFGFGVSHRINMLVPYIGIKWAHAKVDMDRSRVELTDSAGNTDFVTLFDLENQKDFGYAFGVSLVDCEKASITAEARFSDEKAFHINGQLRF